MIWKQREQQMKEQLFQMMMMMNAGNKNPQAMMQQYYLLQNKIAQNFPSYSPQADLNQHGYKMQNQEQSSNKPQSETIFQVQTQFQSLPKIIPNLPSGQNHQFSTGQLSDRTQFTIPQNTTFVPIQGSVNSSIINIHAKVDPQQFQKSLSSETKLLNIHHITQNKLKNKAQEIHEERLSGRKMQNDKILGQTWVANEIDQSLHQQAKMYKLISQKHQIKQEDNFGQSQGSYKVFNQNIQEINQELNQLAGKAESVRQKMQEASSNRNRDESDTIKEKSQNSQKVQNSWDDRDDLNEDDDGDDDDEDNEDRDKGDKDTQRNQHITANSTTFKIKGTGEYSPMSTGKRQTFYDQLKSIQFSGGNQALANLKTSLQKVDDNHHHHHDDHHQGQIEGSRDRFNLQQSQKLQQYMRSIERKVEAELEVQRKTKGFKVYSTQELHQISKQKFYASSEKQIQQQLELQSNKNSQIKSMRKSWGSKKKQQSNKKILDNEQQTEHQPPAQTLQKIMSDLQQGYQNDNEINIACTQQNTLPQSTLNLMVSNIENDCKALQKANKKFQSAARLHTAQKDQQYTQEQREIIPQQDIAQLRPPTGDWQQTVQTNFKEESKSLNQTHSNCEPLQGLKFQGNQQIQLSKPSLLYNHQGGNIHSSKNMNDYDDINDIKPPQKVQRVVNHTPERMGTGATLYSQFNLAAGEESATMRDSNTNLQPNPRCFVEKRSKDIAAQTLYNEKKFSTSPVEGQELCANTYSNGFNDEQGGSNNNNVKKMKLTSLSDLRGQVKKSKMRDSQIVNGLEKHLKQLEDQVQSSKGFDKYKKQLKPQYQHQAQQRHQQPLKQYDSGELKFNNKIDEMISQFEPPQHLTEKAKS